MIFYGLKPMVAALIVYAAYRVGTNGQPLLGINGHTLAALLIFIFAMIGTMKYHLHPLVVLSVSALMGIAFLCKRQYAAVQAERTVRQILL